MRGISLPIVRRELLVSSRKRLTFWSRIVAAAAGFSAVFLVLGIEPDLMSAGALGAKLFRWLANPAFFICLVGGALLTADCLSIEKREGTLGLLFLTDLKGYDVVFGKLVAKSLTGVYCLLAILPMLAIPILLGGVSGPDFWRVVLVLLNTTFVSLSVGILASVLCRDTRNVFTVALFIIFALEIVPVILREFVSSRSRTIPLPLGSGLSFALATPGSFLFSSRAFFLSLIVPHLLGWSCLIFASIRVQKIWHEQPKTKEKRSRWREWSRGSPTVRLNLRRTLLPVNAILWLESRDRLLPILLTSLFLTIALGCGFLNQVAGMHWSYASDSIFTVFFLHFLLLLLLAFEAGSRLVAARQDGMLTMVLATRMSVEEIMRGEILALKRLFRWPLRIVLTFDLLWLASVLNYNRRPSDTVLILIAGASLMAVLLTNCWSLSWTAMLHGLRAKRTAHAAIKAFSQIVLLPAGMTMLAMSPAPKSFFAGMMVFTVINLVNAWIFGRTSRQRLKEEFRESLTEHRAETGNDLNENYALMK